MSLNVFRNHLPTNTVNSPSDNPRNALPLNDGVSQGALSQETNTALINNGDVPVAFVSLSEITDELKSPPNADVEPVELSFNFLPDTEAEPTVAPGLKEIASGAAVMQAGQEGASIQELRNLLNKAGYPTPVSESFDDGLKEALGQFQVDRGLVSEGSQYQGLVGKQTLSELQSSGRWGKYSPQLGQALAANARAHASGGVGDCYKYVANAIDAKVGRFLTGMHAYMAADQLAASPQFNEVKNSGPLNKLPAGAVVVWGKGSSDSGHISIADGKGNEISDHIGPQMMSHYGGASARVFVPVAR